MGNNAASDEIDIRGSDVPVPTQQAAQLATAAQAGPAATIAAAGLPATLSGLAAKASDQNALRVVPNASTGSTGDGPAASVQPALGTSTQSPALPPTLDTASTQATQAPPASPQGESLIASLTRIQRDDSTAPTSGNLAFTASLTTLRTANLVRELRGTSLGSSLGHVDSAMLEIVAVLFDQIFACEEIPPGMKRLIGRLQIPILKVAILDNSFLGVTTHPARKLLDCLGAIAVSLDGDLDESSPLYVQIQTIVQELVDGFQDGMEIFVRLHEELERFVAWQNQPVEEQGKLVAKRIECRERLALAKAVAQQEIQRRARSGSIPRVVLRFLVEHWVKIMLVAHARRGDESSAWHKAVGTMDLLIWSVRPKHSLAERRTLAAVLPKLLRRLNIGMRNLGIEDEDRKRFFAALMSCHTQAMNAAPSNVGGPAASALLARPLPTTQVAALDIDRQLAADLSNLGGQTPGRFAGGPHRSEPRAAVPPRENDDLEPMTAPLEFRALTIRDPLGNGDIEIEEIDLCDLSVGGTWALGAGRAGTATIGNGHSRVVGSLEEGAWVDFRDGNNKRRARLFYVSPLRRTYLFVNVQTGNVWEYSVDQLAREFRTGRANVIESRSLFDQAMGGLVGAQRTRGPLH